MNQSRLVRSLQYFQKGHSWQKTSRQSMHSQSAIRLPGCPSVQTELTIICVGTVSMTLRLHYAGSDRFFELNHFFALQRALRETNLLLHHALYRKADGHFSRLFCCSQLIKSRLSVMTLNPELNGKNEQKRKEKHDRVLIHPVRTARTCS